MSEKDTWLAGKREKNSLIEFGTKIAIIHNVEKGCKNDIE